MGKLSRLGAEDGEVGVRFVTLGSNFIKIIHYKLKGEQLRG